MARREADREDIMREAQALRRRLSLSAPGTSEPVVCGARANGYWSFYLDTNTVYQVDDQLRLRRAYVDGFLYRTQGATLARMHRERSEAETSLVRTDLTPHELSQFVEQMKSGLELMHRALRSGEAKVIETIPANEDVRSELESILSQLMSRPIVLAPAIRARP